MHSSVLHNGKTVWIQEQLEVLRTQLGNDCFSPEECRTVIYVNSKGPRCHRDGSKSRSHPAGILPCWLLLLLSVTLPLVRWKVEMLPLDFDLMPSGKLLKSFPQWALASASASLNTSHTSLWNESLDHEPASSFLWVENLSGPRPFFGSFLAMQVP